MTNPDASTFNDDSRLFQRTRPPAPNHRLAAVARAFAFGGGGSGLNRESMDAIAQVLEFDYMGAAEYEFGACGRNVVFMLEHVADLESTEHRGLYFLTHKNHTPAAHRLWDRLLDGVHAPRDPPLHGPAERD